MAVLSIPESGRTTQRTTEGSKQTGAVSRTRNLSGAKRQRGRPIGSKTRTKSLIPYDMADQMLGAFEGNIPKEHFDYLKSVLKGSGTVQTEKELDILILLLGRNLHPALIGEMGGEEEMQVSEETGEITTVKKVVFRRDVTERLKVLNSLLSLRHQVEKAKDDGKDGEQPLLKIVADRALLDGGRLGILVGRVSGPVVGDFDGTGRPAIPPRTVSS